VGEWESIDALTKRLWPRAKDSMGAVNHALRTFQPGDRPPRPDLPTLDELQSVLLDYRVAQAWYGQRYVVVRTREGLRYPSPSMANVAAQSHCEQDLAVLGELGVSLDTPLQTPVGMLPLRLALADAIANFRIDSELEWTTVALALYLPPQRTWQNKAGEHFSFDDVAQALIARRLTVTACRGTHCLYALAVLMRVDEMRPVLSPPIRDAVRSFLAHTAMVVPQTQLPTGAFPTGWYGLLFSKSWYWDAVKSAHKDAEFDPELVEGWTSEEMEPEELVDKDDTPMEMGHITGHHVEWLMLLPEELQPEDIVYQRAAEFLMEVLRAEKEDENLHANICEFHHPARVLRVLGRPRGSAKEPVVSNVEL